MGGIYYIHKVKQKSLPDASPETITANEHKTAVPEGGGGVQKSLRALRIKYTSFFSLKIGRPDGRPINLPKNIYKK